jgi:hypothetical protein
MSHEREATQRLLDKVQYYFKHINGPKPSLSKSSRNEMAFDKTDSTFYIGTAGAKAFGRGDTITDLHCSEYAWWEETAVHQGGVFEAVPITGQIIIESTGNGRNNDFYAKWQKGEYERLFYPWFAGYEYEIHSEERWFPDIPRLNGYLLDLRDKFKLSDAKMRWYTWKLKSKEENLRIMQQEYPSEPEECFQASGGALFPNVKLSLTDLWKQVKLEGLHAYALRGHPVEGYTYVIGADPSGGTGNDDAAFVGICVQTGEQVLEFQNNNTPPVQFADLLCSTAKRYNNAYLVPEANNHGITVVEVLKEKYDRSQLHKRKLATTGSPAQYGWMNNNSTKHALVGLIQEELDQIIIYGGSTQAELTSYEETPDGKLGSKSDNLVIAFGLALLGYKRFQHLRDSHLFRPAPPAKERPSYMTFSLDEILQNFKQRRQGEGFFKNQVGRGYPN